MSYTYQTTVEQTSSTGYKTVLSDGNETLQIDSILNADSTVNETASEERVLALFEEYISVQDFINNLGT